MKLETLQKFSKEDLMKFYTRQSERLEYYENKCKNQEKIGQIFFNHKRYNVIFEREE